MQDISGKDASRLGVEYVKDPSLCMYLIKSPLTPHVVCNAAKNTI